MNKTLEELRKEIDEIDNELLHLFAKRMSVSTLVGKVKKEKGVVALDMKRWEKVLESRLEKAKELDLPKEFVEKVYHLIHEHSLQRQK